MSVGANFTPESKISLGLLGGILAAIVTGLSGLGLILWRGGSYVARVDANQEVVNLRLEKIELSLEDLKDAITNDRWTVTDQRSFVKRLVRELTRVHPEIDLDENNL